MSDWHYDSWLQEFYMSGKIVVIFTVVLIVILVASVFWFIDGIKKYGYWFEEDEEK